MKAMWHEVRVESSEYMYRHVDVIPPWSDTLLMSRSEIKDGILTVQYRQLSTEELAKKKQKSSMTKKNMQNTWS